jgi:diaminopimelate decarboxylase
MMISSNWLDPEPALFTLDMLAEQALILREKLGIEVEWIDVGGGFGIPFRPGEPGLDLTAVAAGYRASIANWPSDWHPTICFEHGIHMTGAHGVLVAQVRQRMSKWRQIVGVDVSTNALMRPVLYRDAYHHITVPGAGGRPAEVVDVVGSLCTDLDRIASGRRLPALEPGDLLIVHDAGAHGHSWGHNYNGRLRPKELLLHGDGSVELIRRAESADDYFATLSYAPSTLHPALAG